MTLAKPLRTLLRGSMLALCVAVASATSAAVQSDGVLAVRFEDGRGARVSVLAVDGDRARLETFVMGGSVTTTRDLAQFMPMSRLRILEAVSDLSSFDARFELAKRAAGWRLLEPAGKHAQAALDVVTGRPDAAEKEAAVRAWAADALEAAIVRSVGEGELEYARHCLKLLTTRLPDARSEERLDELTALVDELDAQLREIPSAARRSGRDASEARAMERQLATVVERMELGDRRLRESIASSRQTVKSSRLAESAIEAYRSAWTAAQELLARAAGDAALAEEVASIGERVQEQTVRAALHVANVLTVQSDYKNALAWTDRVIALDPDNREAAEMRRTIHVAAAAASNVWGWGWWLPGGFPGAPPSGGPNR